MKEWLELQGVKALHVVSSIGDDDYGRFVINVSIEPGVDVEELVARMYPDGHQMQWSRQPPPVGWDK